MLETHRVLRDAPELTTDVQSIPVKVIEREGSATKLVNLSGHEDGEEWYVRQHIGELLGVATDLVVFPDFSPTEPGRIPTGVVARFDTRKTPDFLRFVGGADIGCGMSWARLHDPSTGRPLSSVQLLDEQAKIDKLYQRLQESKVPSAQAQADLGGGNHFIDLTDNDGEVGVLIHTGSLGDMQKRLSAFTSNPAKYWEFYKTVIVSAQENRKRLMQLVSEVFGTLVDERETVHNTVELSRDGLVATVYKGVVNVQRYPGQQVIPSSMEGDILFFNPGKGVSEEVLHGMSHGTGRSVKRGDMKLLENLPSPTILKATQGTYPITEHPRAYHSLQRSNDVLSRYGLIDPSQVSIATPLVYFGHI